MGLSLVRENDDSRAAGDSRDDRRPGLIVFAGLVAKKVAAKDYWAYEDLPSAVDHVRSKIAPGEVLYVHTSSRRAGEAAIQTAGVAKSTGGLWRYRASVLPATEAAWRDQQESKLHPSGPRPPFFE